MSDISLSRHDHFFLGEGHEKNERRTWMLVGLCTFMMVAEAVSGLLGSIALVADGLHLSTHTSALLLAALAYRYARHYADDTRFSFGTGKLDDLAGFTSAIILAMISSHRLRGHDARHSPVPIHYTETHPNRCPPVDRECREHAAASCGGHDHGHSHSHATRYGSTDCRGAPAAGEFHVPLEADQFDEVSLPPANTIPDFLDRCR
jgi:hypothetical protein